jgi:serine protease AprX
MCIQRARSADTVRVSVETPFQKGSCMSAPVFTRLLPTTVGALLLLSGLITPASLPLRASPAESAKLGPVARQRAALSSGRSRVILQVADLAAARAAVIGAGGTLGRRLPSISSQVATLPNAALAGLSSSASILRIAMDRNMSAATERTGATIGATAVRQQLGYDGAGIGIAVIDSGGNADHDDLNDPSGSRIDRFVDFVNGRTTAYDDYGHGTHVAGIIAGNGFDSSGRRTGISPAARLVVLKALDADGNGHISDVIAAIEYAVANRDALNIRIINLSVASGVYESYQTDPLTRATLCAVRAGMVVVAAAGNNGVSPQGFTRYGGITAPGNAPWVLTVGGSSHMGTIDRGDDGMALFSSRGPTAIDAAAKPDVVAPGVGIESLAAPGSRLYASLAPYLLDGTVATPDKPYLSMSGTSMAAPVVAGTVALMLQANPALTPNQVKAILQYTAEVDSHSDPLTQGAGFLNARGAVELARFLATSAGAYPDASRWSRRLLWGNYLFKNGRLSADASAWPADVTWGSMVAPGGAPIDWGVICADATCSTTAGPWALTSAHRNVVWGNACGGDSCESPWSLAGVTPALDNGDTVVWGTLDDGDTVVWGTIADGETVVWGTSDSGETVVWGTSCSGPACIPSLWR